MKLVLLEGSDRTLCAGQWPARARGAPEWSNPIGWGCCGAFLPPWQAVTVSGTEAEQTTVAVCCEQCKCQNRCSKANVGHDNQQSLPSDDSQADARGALAATAGCRPSLGILLWCVPAPPRLCPLSTPATATQPTFFGKALNRLHVPFMEGSSSSTSV